MTVIALPNQSCAGLCGLLGLVGALHAHIVLFSLLDFLVEFPQRSIGGGIPYRMGQFGGRLLLVLQHQLRGYFAGLRVHRLLPDLLFRNFGLRLIRFGGGLVRLTDGLFQRRVSPFLVRKAQARLLSQTILPSSGRLSCSAAPHRGPTPGDHGWGAGSDRRRSAPPQRPAVQIARPRR